MNKDQNAVTIDTQNPDSNSEKFKSAGVPNLISDFQISIASINGSGTLTANRILHKTLFRSGYNVVGKNLFPSNIEGLPTYYFLRISKDAKTLKTENEVYVALNPSTYARDLQTLVNPNTTFLLNTDLKLESPHTQSHFDFSFKKTVASSKANIKIKKRMANMSYVGWLARYLNLDFEILKDVILDQFSSNIIADENMGVVLEGWNSFGGTPLNFDQSIKTDNSNHIMIEGNQAAALGWVDQGCMVATWYPITPSTSLVESFETYAKSLRPLTAEGQQPVAVVQSEDEISAIASVIGAGWAGARAATATSGPGLSLMSEALGLAYFAEIPAVVCDVQRVGPSTGLPTRTAQGDIEFAYKISHGDTFHPVLLPADPKDCYEMSAQAFDIADKYQTPVLVMSDLDIGMNLWTSDRFKQVTQAYERSQILTELDLEKINDEGKRFKRYLGDENGIPKRTLPGTHHKDAAYFTRGSGHNESAGYSEHPEDYENLMVRLKNKVLNSRLDLPKPKITYSKNQSKIGVICYGSTGQIFPEIHQILKDDSCIGEINTCLVQSLPLHNEVFNFINEHELIFIIEQNRDGQLKNIIQQDLDRSCSARIISVTSFDGWSVQADKIARKMHLALSTVGTAHGK